MNNNEGHEGLNKFDVASFLEQVNTLRVGNQEFTSRLVEADIESDYGIAVAVALAHRTTNIEFTMQEDMNDGTTPTIEFTHAGRDMKDDNSERQYLDSRELGNNLRRHPFIQSMGRSRTHIDIPVIVLQLDRDAAILLDQHYNARSLKDMILIVQNSARFDEHPSGMMCNNQLMARPLSPLKEALSAVLQHLGGILPPHLGYDPLRKHVTHDWLWSVGSHPLSFTSTGLRYTTIQRDALARSYVLDAMDSAIDVLNMGIRKLEGTRTTHRMYDHVATAKKTLVLFSDIIGILRTMSHSAYSLDFQLSVDKISVLQGVAKEFLEIATDLATSHEAMQCIGRDRDERSPHVTPLLFTSGVIAAVAIIYTIIPLFTRKKERRLTY
eukprot:gene13741-19644_t